MMDTGWAEKEQEDTGTQICRELMEKLDIKSYETVTEGLSGDRKFHVETSDGGHFLLRLSAGTEYERKKTAFDRMRKADSIGIPMCRPAAFGSCDDGRSVYQLLTWCEGRNGEKLLPFLPETKQYSIGIKAGEILRTIHTIPAPELEPWQKRYFNENDCRIKAFSDCGIRIDGSDILLAFVENNRHLLNGRPQCLQHGDYHVGNLMITDAGEVSVIDWELLDFDNYADPWKEFGSIGLTDVHPYFVTGLIRGYFGGEPPLQFWKLLAYYLAVGAVIMVPWAYYLQKDELPYAVKHVKDVLRWFDNFRRDVPEWFCPERL